MKNNAGCFDEPQISHFVNLDHVQNWYQYVICNVRMVNLDNFGV